MSKKGGAKGACGRKEEEICKVCKADNDKDDRWIQCDVCANWNHVGCAELDENEYEVLKKVEEKSSGFAESVIFRILWRH